MKELLKALREAPRDEYVTRDIKDPEIDWDKIEEFEGGRATKGYVPASGKSGVTLGAGFDVGQRNSLEGLPESIQAKAAPYLGLKRGIADDALAKSGGINLTSEEADVVTQFARNETQSKLQNEWQKMSNVPFGDLSPAQQTVLASVMHQYGSLSRTPRFSQFAGKGQWENVVEELRNFKDDYKTRRNREADMLQEALKKNRLP
jgi:hypothetical protein